jgi:hypothetical protein
LRQSAATIGQGQSGASTRKTADDRLALAVKTAPQRPLPLAALVIPSPSRTASNVAFKRLEPSTALFALLSFPRVHGWQRSDVMTRDFSTLTAVVNRVPTYDATIPWGPPFDPDVAESLLRLSTELPNTDRRLPLDTPSPEFHGSVDGGEREVIDECLARRARDPT